MSEYPVSICPQRFRFQVDDQSLGLPCCWSHPIDQKNENIQQIVIIIHGVLRNADEYYPNMMAVVEQAGKQDSTLVIAPQFLIEEDALRFDLPEEIPYWGGKWGEAWKKGDESLTTEGYPRSVKISSFAVIDRLIKLVTEPPNFPNLQRIVVAGHSAGGQYVNRYAAGTLVEEALPKNIRLRYIVANPSTYVYFNGDRRVEDTTDQFGLPENPEPDYDDYKYGLEKLNSYMSAAGAEKIRKMYPQKDVVYLLGGEDTREAHLEQTPNAMLQGINRLARGQIYYHYLKHYFGKEICQIQKIAIIPCVGHDNAAIFKSEAGLKYLFGDL
jgi:hypothetical protein